MFGDHAQFGNRKAVVRCAGTHGSAGFVSDKFYVMAHMGLEINSAGGDLENLTAAVFRNREVAIRSPQAAFHRDRVRIAAGGGSLCKSQGHQHGRYKHH
jgi:hypothetical protein